MGAKDEIKQLIDEKSGVGINYKIDIKNWYDGSPMDDSKLDPVVFQKKDNIYYQRTFDDLDTKNLIKENIEDLKNISETEILLLKMGVYKSVEVQGYFERGDTPKPINYYLSESIQNDNGGNRIDSIAGDKFECFFTSMVDASYFGVITGKTCADNFQRLIDFAYKKEIVLGNGGYYFDKSVVLKSGLRIIGVGNVGSIDGSAIIPTADKINDPDFVIFINDDSIEDVTIFNVRTYKGGYGYKFDISNYHVTKFNWVFCVFQEHINWPISFEGDAVNGAYVNNWDTCFFKSTKGVYCQGSFNINTFTKCGFENMTGEYLKLDEPAVVSQNINFNKCRFESVSNQNVASCFVTKGKTYGFYVKDCYFESVFTVIHDSLDTENINYQDNTHTSSTANAFTLNIDGGNISLINNNTIVAMVLNLSNNAKVPLCIGNKFLNYSGHTPETFGVINNTYGDAPKSVSNLGFLNKGVKYLGNGILDSGEYVFSKDATHNTPFALLTFTGGSDEGQGFTSRSNLSLEILINVNATNDGGQTKQKTYKFLVNVSFYAGLNCRIDIEQIGASSDLILSASSLSAIGGVLTANLNAGSSTGNTVLINCKTSYVNSNQLATNISFQ